MKIPMSFSISGILIAICLMITTHIASAQEQETSKTETQVARFGIKGGINFSNLYVNNVQNQYVKTGGQIGLFAKLPIAKGLSVLPELLYTNKGASVAYGNNLAGSGEYRFNLNYLEMPLLLALNITPAFSVHAGGYAAYLTSANVKDVKSDGSINSVTILEAGDFNRMDYGLAIGLGVDIKKFTVGARYSYGLQDIGKAGTLAGDLTQNAKNSVATLYLGFYFK